MRHFISGQIESEITLEDGSTIYNLPNHFGKNCRSIQFSIKMKEEETLYETAQKYADELIRQTPLDWIPTCECTCDICKGYCEYRSCWGTPSEISKLIDEGFADSLMLDWYSFEDDVLVLVPAITGHEGGVSPYDPRGSCTFYKNGLCEIHDMKPLEGRISSHDRKDSKYNVHERIAKTWDSYDGTKLVNKWRKIVDCWDTPYKAMTLSESWSLLL
jgi:hypothetical protein